MSYSAGLWLCNYWSFFVFLDCPPTLAAWSTNMGVVWAIQRLSPSFHNSISDLFSRRLSGCAGKGAAFVPIRIFKLKEKKDFLQPIKNYRNRSKFCSSVLVNRASRRSSNRWLLFTGKENSLQMKWERIGSRFTRYSQIYIYRIIMTSGFDTASPSS